MKAFAAAVTVADETELWLRWPWRRSRGSIGVAWDGELPCSAAQRCAAPRETTRSTRDDGGAPPQHIHVGTCIQKHSHTVT
eukprot:6205619-Pleurochrysis_carterae.AAC.2